MLSREEQLAIELHKFYRAAMLAMTRVSRSRMHDHGWSLCGKKSQEYFLNRAKLILKRAESSLEGPHCLQEIEDKLRAQMLVLGYGILKKNDMQSLLSRRDKAVKSLLVNLLPLSRERCFSILTSWMSIENLEDCAALQQEHTNEAAALVRADEDEGTRD